MDIVHKARSKTFVSMDSLWYEEERLNTFIDWSVPFLSSKELAKEGLYYLRARDHCACAFCRGIIGAWEEGDIPREEHKRHFPHCPFVQGKATPNVTLKEGKIKALRSKSSLCSFGHRQFCVPERKEFSDFKSRLNSFKNWPEKVTQTPKNLAEAGFYYCGLSDHVRCFHCGLGLRNWELFDQPWEQHARFFSSCHYILLKKGFEFVYKVKRDRTYYDLGKNSTQSSQTMKPSLGMNDEEIEKLMELEVIQRVLEMGFSKDVVRRALKKKIKISGHLFLSTEACISAALLEMESRRIS